MKCRDAGVYSKFALYKNLSRQKVGKISKKYLQKSLF